MWAIVSNESRDRDDIVRFDRNDPDSGDIRLALEGADETEKRRAASRLLSRYQDKVYAWCFRYTREHESALDLAQDVLLGAYRNLGNYVHRTKFSTWLFVVARNRCISEMRKRPRDEVLGLDLDLLTGGSPDPESALEDKEGRERILGIMRNHLDPQEQDALFLRCFERMPVDGITEVLAIKESSGARAVLQRARRKLKAALAGEERN